MPIQQMFLGAGSAGGNLWYGGRGVAGGSYTSPIETIQYWTIANTGNASDFGNLTQGRNELGGCSNAVRGLFMSGYYPSGPTSSNTIDYITIANTGNATDFGDMNWAAYYPGAMASKTDRGVVGAGMLATSPQTGNNAIDYVTISSTGNGTDFGDLTAAYAPGTATNGTRGVWACGGAPPSPTSNIIQYVTLDSTGNATDFGDSTVTVYNHQGTSSDESNDRGVFAGGNTSPANTVIDYITISSTGNATDFGDLTVGRRGCAATSNGSRAVFGGGHPNAASPTIDYITIASTGNATDFGDMFQDTWSAAGLAGD